METAGRVLQRTRLLSLLKSLQQLEEKLGLIKKEGVQENRFNLGFVKEKAVLLVRGKVVLIEFEERKVKEEAVVEAAISAMASKEQDKLGGGIYIYIYLHNMYILLSIFILNNNIFLSPLLQP